MLVGLHGIAPPQFKDNNNGSVGMFCPEQPQGETTLRPESSTVSHVGLIALNIYIIYGNISVIKKSTVLGRER